MFKNRNNTRVTMDKSDKIIVGISIGDLNGIGLEVVLKTFQDKRMLDFCTPLLFGSTKVVSYHKKALKIETPVHGITSLNQINHNKINVLNIWKEDVSIELGKATKISGDYAAKSLETAVKYLKEKKVDVLLTAPINKETIQSETFNFPGHTEYLEANLDGKSLMILMTDKLRIGLITGHIPISKVAESITPILIKEKKAALSGVASGRAGNLRGIDHLTGILHHVGTTVMPQSLPLSSIASLCDDNGEINKATGNLMGDFVDAFLKF